MIKDADTALIGMRKYLDAFQRFDELSKDDKISFLNGFKRDYNILILFMEEVIKK